MREVGDVLLRKMRDDVKSDIQFFMQGKSPRNDVSYDVWRKVAFGELWFVMNRVENEVMLNVRRDVWDNMRPKQDGDA